ncbi:hypothetical protein RB598_007361 [Gaeumannomyces tritici]
MRVAETSPLFNGPKPKIHFRPSLSRLYPSLNMIPRGTHLTALLATASSLHVAWASTPCGGGPDLETDVLVVGGGSAGTYAAVRLADGGRRVLVVEGSGKLGGHASTYADPATGGVVNAGVQMLHNDSVVRAYCGRLGVPLSPVPPRNPLRRAQVDLRTGREVTGFPGPTGNETLAAFARYQQYYVANFPDLERGYDGVPDPVPADAAMPFVDLAKREGFDAILKTLNSYNQPTDMLAETSLFTLKSFGPSLINLSPVAPRDLMDIYRAAAGVLGDRVLLRSKIVKLDRTGAGGGGGVVAKVRTFDGATGHSTVRTVRAKTVLMATYPLPSNLQGWDVTAEEARLFSKLKAYSYFAGVIRNRGAGGVQIENVSPERFRGVPELPAIFNIGPTQLPDTYTVYFGARGFMANDTALDLTLAAIGRLAEGGVIGSAETEVLAWFDHTPVRLHVGAEDVAAGYYKDLYALQGKTKTWWTGAAWQTQDSSQIWAFTQRLVERMLDS